MLTRTLTGFALGGLPTAAPATAQDAPARQQLSAYTAPMLLPHAKAAGVDAQIGSHPLHFDGPTRLEILKFRQKDQPTPLSWAQPVCSATWTCNVSAF